MFDAGLSCSFYAGWWCNAFFSIFGFIGLMTITIAIIIMIIQSSRENKTWTSE